METPEQFYKNLKEKKSFTKLTGTGISDNLENVFEFAKLYMEQMTEDKTNEIKRRRDLILSEPNGIVREQMIDDLILDL